jgi:protein-S-isoprenylcysteine O-methyltransferase Ste14
MHTFKSLLADATFIVLGYILYTQAPYFNNVLSGKVIDFLPLLASCLFLCSIVSSFYQKVIYKQPYISTCYKALVFVVIKLKELLIFNSQKAISNSPNNTFQFSFFIVLVKVFYIPLMLQFSINNFLFLTNYLGQFVEGSKNLSGSFFISFSYVFYPFLISCCFFVDTVFFLFGYLIYSDSLGNTIKSVESTFLGWVVALLCYPPFNYFTANFIPALYQDQPETTQLINTFFLRVTMLFFLIIYTLASVNLGWKCSNLTNRGIVNKGVYSWVRHPAYISKNIFWWLSILPIIASNPMAILYMSAWSFLYFLRAITEERHLSNDPEYVEYCRKVQYRFIPKII